MKLVDDNKDHTVEIVVGAVEPVKKLRTMFRKCRFVSPISHPDYRGQIRDRYRIYCNEETISSFEDVVRSHNQNLGKDLAMFDGAQAAARLTVYAMRLMLRCHALPACPPRIRRAPRTLPRAIVRGQGLTLRLSWRSRQICAGANRPTRPRRHEPHRVAPDRQRHRMRCPL